MPDYKKKRIGFKAKKKSKKPSVDNSFNDIEMKPSADGEVQSSKSNIKVVKGKKLVRIRRFKILGVIALVLIVAYIVLSLVLPISIGENLTNWIATWGSGDYPQEIYGARTLNAVSKGSYYYVLTDTNISAFSNSGKEIYTISHGYSKPVLDTCETRALVYDQNGNSLRIFNLTEQTNSLTTDEPIMAASITRNGSYAVVTESDQYASVVTLYDLDDKKLYEWKSAKDKVNSVAVSSSGEKIAVSTLNAVGGSLVSNVYVFDCEEGKEYSYTVNDGCVYGVYNIGDAFSVVSSEGFSHIDWDEYKKTDIKSSLSLSMYRESPDGVLLVFNRENDLNDNTVMLVSEDGEKTLEFNFQGIISDIQFSDDHIYCISESKAFIFDNKGKKLGSVECGYGAVRVMPISSNTLVAITDSEIKKLEIKN